jgi:23S rRNA pseudouridine1911/1915/1917 synthase
MPTVLKILYEDDHLVFVNKPAGIIVQRGYDPDEPVLFEQVIERYGARPVFLLQRLDRGTSGVIFFSLSSEANPRLTRQFEKKLIHKQYVALVDGRITTPEVIDAPLARIGPISFGVRDEGKRAITHIAPRVSSSTTTLLDIRLETGRTHQIRAHLAAISHPLVGDWLYGKRDAERPMLHAAHLEMRHPFTNEMLRVDAPLPDDLIEEARKRGVEI